MKILVLGSTGILGRNFIRAAKRKKHKVTAAIRNPGARSALESYGVQIENGSILDKSSLDRLIPEHDAVVNLTSAIPKKVKTNARDWELNDQLRTEGTANILHALKRQQESFYVQAGITFVYGDHDGAWVDESSPLHLNARTKSANEMEQQFLNNAPEGLRGVSFRFSALYHQDAWHTQYMVQELRKRRLPIIGDGSFYWNVIHAEDAAAAILSTIENNKKIEGRQILNVTDDEPVMCRDFLNHLCFLLKVEEPSRMPQFVAKIALGAENTEVLTASYRCRNRKLKDLGWKPLYPTFREGFPTVLQFI